MAESASTSTLANSNYDVFINHRGPDVKKTFASHLYRRLLTYGLRVFLDQPELQRGEYITPQIEGAIGSASVHVAIFSSGYARSTWCLNELLLMLESNSPIIPVFYHMKPAELRWTRGKEGGYAKTLEELEKKITSDPQTREEKLEYASSTIENWRNALSNVAGISGFELEACNGDEGELVDKVVEEVLKKVKNPALDVAKYPTGLDDKINDFEKTVLLQRQLSGQAQILGIVGLGGVGKTTLAKEFFNRKNSNYSRSCFLSDVRDNTSKGCLISLQKKLLKTLNVPDKKIERVDGVDEGIQMLRMHLSSAKALIILDDIDDLNQVDALLPVQTVLHSDSLILITSRNKDVLISSKVEESSIYNLAGLDTQHSRELFCSHAFNQPYPLPGFESLVQKFLKTCNGLPLSLKVFGALLYGKEVSGWEDELVSLEQILPTEIQQRLEISYKSLNKEEQNIFLDIACFFRGQNKDRAIRIWDGSGWQGRRGFQNLRNKCLVEVDTENDIQMHDHLRDMGRDIAEYPGLPCRLWRWTENAIDDLLQRSPVTAVRGIRMLLSDVNEALYGIRLGRLQLLDAESVLVERILTQVKSPNLIWLRWNECPYSSLPSSISMKNLRVLQVQGYGLNTLWKTESQAPLQLRELEIKAPLSNIPKSIGKLKHLECIEIGPVFSFQQCYKIHLGQVFCFQPRHKVHLTKLPEEFCLLQSLKTLVLRSCSEMESLPECFGSLANLQYINLSNCSTLERLPESFGNLRKLKRVNLSNCRGLGRLPDCFGNLRNLEHINLSYCRGLGRLPDCFGNLRNLEHINLSYCCRLEMLPDSFGSLSNLKHINLSYCRGLGRLPDCFGNLKNLQVMQVFGCLNLEGLPNSFLRLINRQYLGLWERKLFGCPDEYHKFCGSADDYDSEIDNVDMIKDIIINNYR